MRTLIWCVVFLAAVAAFGQPAPPSSCCAPIPPNLSAWWTFDEPSGPTAADFGGSVNNFGTDNGAVGHGPGFVGRAVSFSGTNTWISVPNQAEVNFAGNCASGTIDFWIRTGQTNTVAVIDKRQKLTSAPTFLGYEVYLYQGKIGFQMAVGPGSFPCGGTGATCTNFTSPYTVANGQWHFVAITFQRCPSPVGFFYVDGNPPAPFTPRLGDLNNTQALQIGREVPGNFSNTYFRGSLDELEIFQGALTAAQVNAIRTAGERGKCRRY